MVFSREIITTKQKRKWSKESSIKRHDLNNFESKIDYKYTLEQNKKKKTSYLLETFFFFPKSLQINKDTYSREHFFSDLSDRIRFKTPQMSLERILDEKNALSPLNVIISKLDQIQERYSDPSIIRTITRELRLLACIVKTSLRDANRFIIDNYQSINKKDELIEYLKKEIACMQDLKEKIMFIGKKVVNTQIPLELRESYQYSDEYISLQIEKCLINTLANFDKLLAQEMKDLMIKTIESEQEYRVSINSRLVVTEGSTNEDFSYMEGIVKKYLQGALYLKKKKKDPRSSSLQVFYSVAAGFAIFISLFLGFLILTNFEVNSLPFILGTVVIYVLKDRIKDIIKGYSQKAASFLFPDQRIDIIDGFYEEKIGESMEKVYFIDKEKIPPEIFKIRQSSNIYSIEIEGKPEECIIFRKKIVLFKKKIDELHTRRKDISNITRFNIKNFLRYTDDSSKNVLSWNNKTHQLSPIDVSKVYHMNIVMKLTTFHEKNEINTYYKKYRIIINQQGIKKVIEPEFSF